VHSGLAGARHGQRPACADTAQALSNAAIGAHGSLVDAYARGNASAARTAAAAVMQLLADTDALVSADVRLALRLTHSWC
jgi:hypothetical protein